MHSLAPVHLLDTPHACYGAAWSPGGERLAVSGGFLYGQGFLRVLDAAGHLRGGFAGDELARTLILSALCWDDAGSVLLAAACSYKWHAHPPILFEVDGDAGLRVRPLADEPDDDDDDADDPWAMDDHATGCWLHCGRIVLRGPSTWLRGGLLARAVPAAQGLHADERRSALHNARLAVIDGVVYSAKNRANVHLADGTGTRPLVNPHGLAHLELDDPDASPGLTPRADESTLQALARDPAGEHLFGGLRDRTLVRWRVRGRGVVEREHTWQHPRGASSGEGLVVRGVTALCCLPDGRTLVSADHAGALHFWRGDERVATAQIPGPYSPRSLAAHPRAPWLAVGCKSGRGGYHSGAVFRIDLAALA